MMDTAHSVAILAIGTELTDGQILNRNAQWLSQKLTDLGFRVLQHETVPDDRPLMREALARFSSRAGLIFVTGGLGPTTDDFTREVIAEWAGRELKWDEASWAKIVERLGRLGVPVAESNRRQCFFPASSRIYPNAAGTASGFSIEVGQSRAFVLPGPPSELEAIWNDHLDTEVRALAPKSGRKRLFLWRCIGKSESALGEIVEEALKGSGLETGYRAHMPYIEVKVWCEESRVAEAAPWFAKLEKAIRLWLVSSGTDDIGVLFLKKLSARPGLVRILDLASEGHLAQRLGELVASGDFRDVLMEIETRLPAVLEASSESLEGRLSRESASTEVFSVIGPSASNQWAIGYSGIRRLRTQVLLLPFNASSFRERTRRYLGELALFHWHQWLCDGS